MYAGGHFRKLNAAIFAAGVQQEVVAQTHYGLGAMHADTGRALKGWNEGTDTGRGEGWRAMLTVRSVGLFVGGDTDLIQGERRERVGLFPVD